MLLIALVLFFFFITFISLNVSLQKDIFFFILHIYAGLINNNYKVLYIHYYNYPLTFITYIAKFL